MVYSAPPLELTTNVVKYPFAIVTKQTTLTKVNILTRAHMKKTTVFPKMFQRHKIVEQ